MIPKITNNPLDDLQVNESPELTIATITQHYPQINQSWDVATQNATLDGVPYSREYSVLSFPFSETRLTKVDLGNYDPEYEANFYYLVISYFLETSYTSSIYETESLAFSRWTKISTKFRQEATYFHKKTSELIWQRPFTGLETSPLYSPLPENYKLTLNVGKALGAIIECSSTIEVTLKDTVNSQGELVNPSFILLTKPIIEINFKSITPISHTQVKVSFYGEYQWSTQLPVDLANDDNTEVLIHPYETPYESRLLPPGLNNLPTNFWNSNLNNIALVDFSNRTGDPQWS